MKHDHPCLALEPELYILSSRGTPTLHQSSTKAAVEPQSTHECFGV